jgi:hypothetical protein
LTGVECLAILGQAIERASSTCRRSEEKNRMRTSRIGIGLFVALTLVWVGCSKTPFFRGGDKISLKEATPIEQVKSDPRAYVGQKVLVEGTVVGVCKGTGCWAMIEAGPSGERIYAKSADHSVQIPTDCEGSWIRVEGDVVLIEPVGGEDGGKEPAAEGVHEGADEEGAEPHACPMPDCYVDLAAVELVKK